MQLEIGKHDLLYVDLGRSRQEGRSRYVVIVDDEDRGFTDGGTKGATDLGKSILAGYLQSEAYRAGAKPVEMGSKCVVGGDVSLYGDDQIAVLNAGEKVMFVEKELAELLVSRKLASYTQI